MTGHADTRATMAVRAAMAVVVSGVASVAALVSYRHCYELVSGHGEDTLTARLVPLTVDGLVAAASLVLLHSARTGRRAPGLARFLLVVGILGTLGANVAHGVRFGPIGAVVSGWPAVALLGVGELALLLIRAGGPVDPDDTAETVSAAPAPAPALADWLPDTMPARTAAARSDMRPDTVTLSAVASDTTRRRTSDTSSDSDSVARVRSLLATRPDMSGAAIGRALGVSGRTGQRLRQQAIDSQ